MSSEALYQELYAAKCAENLALQQEIARVKAGDHRYALLSEIAAERDELAKKLKKFKSDYAGMQRKVNELMESQEAASS